MTDLLQVLPDLDTRPYSHLLPSLDKALITTSDLVSLEPADVAKRAQLPPADVRRLTDAVVVALHRHLGFGGEEARGNTFLSASGDASDTERGWGCISTLDAKLDAALGGGIRAGYLVEVTGERCVGLDCFAIVHRGKCTC
jgi:DNA repair protein RAD57